jgi:hypothetical protein
MDNLAQYSSSSEEDGDSGRDSPRQGVKRKRTRTATEEGSSGDGIPGPARDLEQRATSDESPSAPPMPISARINAQEEKTWLVRTCLSDVSGET